MAELAEHASPEVTGQAFKQAAMLKRRLKEHTTLAEASASASAAPLLLPALVPQVLQALERELAGLCSAQCMAILRDFDLEGGCLYDGAWMPTPSCAFL